MHLFLKYQMLQKNGIRNERNPTFQTNSVKKKKALWAVLIPLITRFPENMNLVYNIRVFVIFAEDFSKFIRYSKTLVNIGVQYSCSVIYCFIVAVLPYGIYNDQWHMYSCLQLYQHISGDLWWRVLVGEITKLSPLMCVATIGSTLSQIMEFFSKSLSLNSVNSNFFVKRVFNPQPLV